MTEKRFIEFTTQNTDNGEINDGFKDMETGEWYHTKDSENSKNICDLLNRFHKENKKLKEELWEAEIEYIHERYHDNPIREKECINELKEDFKREYWNG